MSYNSLSRPRFYTNSIEYLYNRGVFSSIDPIFLSNSWHTIKDIQIQDQDSSHTDFYSKIYNIDLPQNKILNDFNFIMFLGHNFKSKNVIPRIIVSNTTPNPSINSSLNSSNINFTNNITQSNSDMENPTSVYSIQHDYVPIVIGFTPNTFNNGVDQSEITNIEIKLYSGSAISGVELSGICIGNYYDLPYNPDLGIKKTISYDGVNTYDTISGKTLSSNYGSSRPLNLFPIVYPDESIYDDSDTDLDDSENSGDSLTDYYLGDINNDTLINVVDIVNIVQTILDPTSASELESILADVNQDGNINVVDIVSIVNLVLGNGTAETIEVLSNIRRNLLTSESVDKLFSPSGRRSYDISYSYIGSDSNGQNFIFPRNHNNIYDISNLADSDQTYDETKNNLYTSVINKTIGSHIPFIFSLVSENFEEMMLARFTNKSFESTEQAPNVHSISFGIREVW